jgi:formylglycine-generating enzyme required for sulfatase activity
VAYRYDLEQVLKVLSVVMFFSLSGCNSTPDQAEVDVSDTKTAEAIPASQTAAPTSTPKLTSTPNYTPTPDTSPKQRPMDGMVMVYVPEGEFEMGMNEEDALVECEERNTNCENKLFWTMEEPVHTVFLDAFWIDQTEVTNTMYAKCVEAGVCDLPEEKKSDTHADYYNNRKYADYPVIYVSWNDARTYCEWAGARLPTEAEWEKAARGTDRRIYPWGNAFDKEFANCCTLDWSYSSSTDTMPVGSYPSGTSPYGALDMAGNVWEYVADRYDEDYYANSPSSNPLGPESGDSRVMRGGAWDGYSYHLRSAYRSVTGTDSTGNYIGFRCAMSDPPLLSSMDSISTATPIPTALPLPTLTPPPTPNPGYANVYGRVLWRGQPVEDFPMRLSGWSSDRTDWYWENVSTDKDGCFLFTDVPPGNEFELEGLIARSNFPPGTAGAVSQVVSVVADMNLLSGEYNLVATDLVLLSPVGDPTISDSQPSLSWEPYSGASYYHLELKQFYGSYTDLELDVAEPHVDLTLPLMECRYGWDVTAHAENGMPLARSDFAYWDDTDDFFQKYDGIFTIKNDALPWCEIILITPADRAEFRAGSAYVMSWERHPLAARYTLAINMLHDADGKYILPGQQLIFAESFVDQQEVSGPSLPYLGKGHYEWNVSAYMENGEQIANSRWKEFYIR